MILLAYRDEIFLWNKDFSFPDFTRILEVKNVQAPTLQLNFYYGLIMVVLVFLSWYLSFS